MQADGEPERGEREQTGAGGRNLAVVAFAVLSRGTMGMTDAEDERVRFAIGKRRLIRFRVRGETASWSRTTLE